MNFIVMGDNGALLYDVRYSDERKDDAGIAKILSVAGNDIMGGEDSAADFGGWCIDDTKANRSAIRLLEAAHPTWVNTTCVAHGGALALKDFFKVVKNIGRDSKTYGCAWIKHVNEKASTSANYMQHSGTAKVLLHKHHLRSQESHRCERTHSLWLPCFCAEGRAALKCSAEASGVRS